MDQAGNRDKPAKNVEKADLFFIFENKKEAMTYFIVLKANENSTLNRGTTNSEMTGLSKPTEYQKQ
ncbi:hypothetical protein GIX45_24360 [Erwinia sp. CPCC 100877]|nr:hypothetical protein [Erwinia sp. CPCC 100877]